MPHRNDVMIVIKEVKSKKELRDFVRFPKSLYKDCPHYVPPLDNAEMKDLTSHPALDFCSLRMWLAYQDGKIVGRIAGIINHRCNEMKEQKRIRFGWFDFIDNQQVTELLLKTVEEWGREKGMDTISGPSRFSNMQKQAMLVDGFDKTASIEADYNFPYYPQFVENLGFEKEVDYIQYEVKILDTPEPIVRMAEHVAHKTNVRVRQYKSKKELKKIGREFFTVLNESYQKIYNFIPLTDKEIEWVIKGNFGVAVLDLISVLEDENGKLVGISFCLPSLSKAFQKAKGKLFPFGWLPILRSLRSNDRIDMYLTGILPQYANSGVHLLYHKQLNDIALTKGYRIAYTSQQLEDNPANHIWRKYYDCEPFCRRRCYKKSLSSENYAQSVEGKL